MSKFPWRSCLSTHKAVIFWILGEVKTKRIFRPSKNSHVFEDEIPCPPFFFGSACFAVFQSAARSVDLRSHLQAAWETQQQGGQLTGSEPTLTG